MSPRIALVGITHIDEGLVEEMLQDKRATALFEKLRGQIGLAASLRLYHCSMILGDLKDPWVLIGLPLDYLHYDDYFLVSGTLYQWYHGILELMHKDATPESLYIGKAMVAYINKAGFNIWRDHSRRNTTDGSYYFT